MKAIMLMIFNMVFSHGYISIITVYSLLDDSDAIISSLILNNEPEDIKADYSSFVNLNISAQSQTKSGNNDVSCYFKLPYG